MVKPLGLGAPVNARLTSIIFSKVAFSQHFWKKVGETESRTFPKLPETFSTWYTSLGKFLTGLSRRYQSLWETPRLAPAPASAGSAGSALVSLSQFHGELELGEVEKLAVACHNPPT